jgi:glutathione S-transferase
LLKLYDFPGSICAQKARLILAEKSLAYEKYSVDLYNDEQLGETYLAINSNGVVPSLDHDGAIITDSSAIAEYIDETFPQPALSPALNIPRAHMRTWMRFFEEVTTPAVRWPSWQRVFVPMFKATGGMEKIRMLAVRQPHLSHFYKRIGEDGPQPEIVAEAEEDLRRSFVRMEKALTDGRSFLIDKEPTLADFIVLPLIVRAQDIGLENLWSDLPFVIKWFASMQARPSFGEVFEPPGVRLR